MISSTKNEQVVASAKLKKRALREEKRRFLVEGAQPVTEALEAGAIETLFHTPDAGAHPVVRSAKAAGVRIESVSEQVMTHLTSTVTPQGLLGVARFVDVEFGALPESASLVPVLCAVRDPGNAGTVLRSADAAGAGAVVFAGSSVDVYNPKTVRSSAGSLFHLPVVRDVTVSEAVGALRERGFRILGADAAGSESIYETDLSGPTAVLFGNEAWGLPDEVRSLADSVVRVPIRGRAESLNLAASAAVFLFEAARQQTSGPEFPAGPGIGTAISASAHDLRSSLTAMKGFATTLASMWDRLEDRSRREMVEGLSVDAERVAASMKLLVDGARLEEGRLNPSPDRHDVGADAGWVAEVFSRSEDYPEVLANGGATAMFDPDRLQVLLLTLADQASWWGDAGPVVIEAAEKDGAAIVEVRRGAQSCDPVAVGEAFAQPVPGGKGRIALWLVRRLAEAQGARLEWEGGMGITFRLILPS